jgi:hypothetical protein
MKACMSTSVPDPRHLDKDPDPGPAKWFTDPDPSFFLVGFKMSSQNKRLVFPQGFLLSTLKIGNTFD